MSNQINDLYTAVRRMPLVELVALIRAMDSRLKELFDERGEDLINVLTPADAEMLPASVINYLADQGLLLTVGEASKYLGFNASESVRSAARSKANPLWSIKVGGYRLFKKGGLDAYRLNRSKIKAGRKAQG